MFQLMIHPNECSQEFHYYPSAVRLDIRAGSCNTKFKSKHVQHD